MNVSNKTKFFLAITAMLVTLAPLSAKATEVTRIYSQNGGSACTGALPTYEGALRKRPKAIANEGTTTAYVTCSALTTEDAPNPTGVWAYFTNRGSAWTTVACTLVDGNDYTGSSFYPKSQEFAPNEFGVIYWVPTPPATEFKSSVSLSCALPSGVDLNIFNNRVNEYVGD